MRNRAKCKLCEDIIESVHRHDFMTCKCGEISIDGGAGNGYIRALAKNWENFYYVDDDDSLRAHTIPESMTTSEDVKETVNNDAYEHSQKIDKEYLIDAVAANIAWIEALPISARYTPITNADLLNVYQIIDAMLSIK